MENTAWQGARVGDEQPARAHCCILVRIGFELVAEDGCGLVFDAKRRGVLTGGLDVGQRRTAAKGDESERDCTLPHVARG